MRGKEESHDYRYFPDPDLPPLKISDEKIERLKKSLPELPDMKRKRFRDEFNLSDYDADILSNDKETADFFEKVVNNRDPKIVTSWVTGELFSYLKKNDIPISNAEISPDKLGGIIDLISNGSISNRQAKEVFQEYITSNQSAKEFIENKGLVQVSDKSEIDNLINTVLQENSKMVDEYNNGKERLFGFFVGQVMKISKGKANPNVVNKLLKDKLAKKV